jgi:two-component sensor histidine kinase
MRFLIILVLLSGLSGTPVFCQSTAGGLEVPHITDTTPVETLLARLDHLPPDTFKVQQDLIREKDKLLADKDLLLDEIHHRVQNNLTIIISLLESQSMYLNNQPAQAALQDTQNRIQAVFLLQQKLYGAQKVRK